jgi:hypothetical protein
MPTLASACRARCNACLPVCELHRVGMPQVTVALRDAAGSEHIRRLEAAASTFAVGSEWRGELQLDARLAGGCTSLRVWHDGEGYANSWRLESMTVQEARTGSEGECAGNSEA